MNKTDNTFKIAELPRPLIQLIVIQDSHILISERIEHMAEHLNRYMLPGGLHAFGLNSVANAERIAAKFGLALDPVRIGQAEVISTETTSHTLVDFYAASAPDTDYTFHDDLYTLRFVPLSGLASLDPSLASIIEAYEKATPFLVEIIQ